MKWWGDKFPGHTRFQKVLECSPSLSNKSATCLPSIESIFLRSLETTGAEPKKLRLVAALAHATWRGHIQQRSHPALADTGTFHHPTWERSRPRVVSAIKSLLSLPQFSVSGAGGITMEGTKSLHPRLIDTPRSWPTIFTLRWDAKGWQNQLNP